MTKTGSAIKSAIIKVAITHRLNRGRLIERIGKKEVSVVIVVVIVVVVLVLMLFIKIEIKIVLLRSPFYLNLNKIGSVQPTLL